MPILSIFHLNTNLLMLHIIHFLLITNTGWHFAFILRGSFVKKYFTMKTYIIHGKMRNMLFMF